MRDVTKGLGPDDQILSCVTCGQPVPQSGQAEEAPVEQDGTLQLAGLYAKALYAGRSDEKTLEGAAAMLECLCEMLAPKPAPAEPPRLDPLQNPKRPGYFMNYAADETPAEMVLRKLACWLGVGGYNAPKVDAEVFHDKIIAGVQMLLDAKSAVRAALAEPVGVRTLTYKNQPNNDGAWRLGEACRKAADEPKCGDYIDRGLILLRELQANGYGIVRLASEPAPAADAERAP